MHILTDAFYLITSDGHTNYLLVCDACLVESWILLANKKKTLLEQFQNQTQKLQKEAKSVLIKYIY